MNDELHIASFIVQARPDALAAVRAAVHGLPQAEIAACEGGKAIVLIEAPDSHSVMAAIDALRAVAGVLTVNLVYHHADASEWLAQETSHEHPA